MSPLITGASRGIGAAIARLAAARGHALCINYRRAEAEAEGVEPDVGVFAVRAQVEDDARWRDSTVRNRATPGAGRPDIPCVHSAS